MPNYQKCANQLFTSDDKPALDRATGKLQVVHTRGQAFVAVKDNSLIAPKSVLALKAKFQTLVEQKQKEDADKLAQSQTKQPAEEKKLPTLAKTRKTIKINRIVNPRQVDGNISAYDAAYKSTHKKFRFFEQIEDAPKASRNKSQITHRFNVCDGYPKDIWETSTQHAHNFVPESFPAGFMTNQGIQAMYSTFAKKGVLTGGCDMKRTYQGVK